MAGSDQLIPGFSTAVVGMEIGEKKTVTLAPDEAYGASRPELMQRVAVSELPEGIKAGDQLVAHAGEQQIPVVITEIHDEEAVLDANHPLAGKTLIFDIEIVA